jgi:hypothetical protein
LLKKNNKKKNKKNKKSTNEMVESLDIDCAMNLLSKQGFINIFIFFIYYILILLLL